MGLSNVPLLFAWLLTILCVMSVIRAPRAALLAWVFFAGMLVRPLFGVRTTGLYFSSVTLALLVMVRMIDSLRQGTPLLAPSRLNLPLLSLSAVALVSSLLGNLFYDPDVPGTYWFLLVQTYATVLVLLPVSAALLIGNGLRGSADLRWLYRCFAGLGALLLLAAWLPAARFVQGTNWWPILLSHVVALVYARCLADSGLDPRRRWLGFLFVACSLGSVVVPQLLHPENTQWLSGWLALAIPLVAISALVLGRRLLPVALVLVVALVAFGGPLVQTVIEQTEREGGFVRPLLWRDSLRLGLLRPFFGAGPGNYPDYIQTFGREWVIMTSAYGNYQQVIAEMGFAGLLALSWILVTALVLGLRLFRNATDPFLRALALGVVGALSGQVITSLAGDYLIPAYHNGGHLTICTTIYTWVLIGALIAMEGLQARADRAGSSSRGSR